MALPSFKNLYAFCKSLFNRLIATADALDPSIETTFEFSVADGATADLDFVIANKFEIREVLIEKRGGAGGAVNTIQVQTGGGVAITDAISINIADNTLARSATVDDANSTIAAGGTLRIRRVKAGGNAQCSVLVRGFMRP